MTQAIPVNEAFLKLSASEKKAQYLAELDNPSFWPSLTEAQRNAEIAKIEAIYQSDLADEIHRANFKVTFYKDKSDYQVQTSAEIVAFVYGENGYWPIPIIAPDVTAKSLNYDDMTDEVLESAEAGSMFGWDLPLARIAKSYAEKRIAEDKQANGKPTLYVLNEVYLGVLYGQYLQVLVDRNKGGALHPRPMITDSDNLRVATTADFVKFPLSGLEYYTYEK